MIKKIRNILRRKFFSGVLDLRNFRHNFSFTTSQRYNWSYSEFYNIILETYNSNSDLQEMIEILARGCYSLPVALQRTSDKELDVLPPQVEDFLNNPFSDGGSFYELILTSLISYLVGGEIIFLKKDNKLIYIRPDELTMINFFKGSPFRFTISPQPFIDLKIKEKKPSYENRMKKGMWFNDIAYLKHRNPISRNRGLGIVPSLFNHIGILKEGPKWNFNLLLNEGKPSGILHYPDPLKSHQAIQQGGQSNPQGADSVEDQIQKEYAGPINAGKLMFLRGGLAFTPTTIKPKDLDFIMGLKFSREMLANRLGIPLQLVGSEAKQSFNNVREMKEHFQVATTVPLFNRILTFITQQIIHDFWPELMDYNLCVDEAKTQVASIKKFEKLEMMQKAGIYTTNEMRVEMGLEELKIPNADVPIVKGGMPLDMLGNAHIIGDDTEGEDDEKDEDDKAKDDKKPKKKNYPQ